MIWLDVLWLDTSIYEFIQQFFKQKVSKGVHQVNEGSAMLTVSNPHALAQSRSCI